MSEMPNRIHIFGASGSGCTTLGASLAERLALPHLEADAYLWLPTEPPFSHTRERDERQRLLRRDIEFHDAWILSGSLCGWGDLVKPWLTLAVFVIVPTPLRMQRLAARESQRHGATIEPGGVNHDRHVEFMAWAARYDEGDLSVRSRSLHERWLATLSCPVLRIEGDVANDERVSRVVESARGLTT